MKSMFWLKPFAGFVSIVALASCGGGDGGGSGGSGQTNGPEVVAVEIVDENGGSVEVGDMLSVIYNVVADDSSMDVSTRYVWRSNGEIVSEANDTYLVSNLDQGKQITASVIASYIGGDEGAPGESSPVTVAVKATNTPPVAAISPSQFQVIAGETFTLDASSSTDSDGVISSYVWTVENSDIEFRGKTTQASFTSAGTYTITLRVKDNRGEVGTASATVIVVANTLPVANAGNDFSVQAGQTASFDGSSSTDADGTITSYAWSSSVGNLSGAQPSTVINAVGQYTYTLTVTDNLGGTDTDEVVVTVTPANTAPTANAGADISINAGQVANFNGTGSSDAEGAITLYAWTSSALSSALTGAQPTALFNTAGTYTVTLTVTDSGGLTDTDDVMVNVNALPVAVIAADTDAVVVGGTVNFNADSSTDSDGTIASAVWSSTAFESDLLGSVQAPVFNTAGSFVVTLTVTDNDGATSQSMITIDVEDENNAPVASVGETKSITVAVNEVINLNGTASTDSEDNIVSYTWSSEDLPEDLTGAEQTTSFSEAGVYEITLTVEDAFGLIDTDVLTVTVQPDTVDAVAGNDVEIEEGETVSFDASASFTDPEAETVTYTWSCECFDSDLTGETADYTFETAGEFTVTLTVDVDGVTDTDDLVVTVNEYNDAPVADAGDSFNITVNTAVTFDGSGSSDVQDGSPVAYTWASDAFESDLTSVSPEFTFTTVGSYTVTLTVEDSAGETDTDVITVTVLEEGVPIANAGSDVTIEVGQSVSLDASGSTDDVAIASYEWTNKYWDEAVTGATPDAITFNALGVYEITLTVADGEDPANSSTDVVVVTVTQPAEAMDLDGDANAISSRYPGVTKEGDEWVVIFHAPEVAAPFFGAETTAVASVRIFGDFTKENPESSDFESLQNGVELIPTVDGNYYWLRAVDEAFAQAPQHGDEYRFALIDAEGNNIVTVQDPAARWVTSSNVNRMEFELFEGEEVIEAGMSKIYLSDNYVWETPNGSGMDEWQRPAWGYYNIYQLHPSRFTDRNGAANAFAEVAAELDASGENDYINDLGVTAIQLLPVYEFPGEESWGYNPSFFYAIESAYGGPDALKALVDEAHGNGIAVVLDIVVNHMGTGDNILFQIDPYQYDSDTEMVTDESVYIDGDTVWGGLPNFDNDIAKHYFLNHVKYLAEEFNIDAFRFDSTHTVYKTAPLDRENVNTATETETIRIDGSGGGYAFLQDLYAELKAVDGAILMMAEEFPNNFDLTATGMNVMDSLWSQATHYELPNALTGTVSWDTAINTNGLFSELGDDWQDNTNYIESHDSAAAFTSTDEDGNFEACLSDEGKRFATKFDAAVAKQYTQIAMAGSMLAQGIPMNFMGFEAAETTGFYSDLRCYGMTYTKVVGDEEVEVMIDDEPTLPLTTYELAEDTESEALRAWYKALSELRINDQTDNNGASLIWGASEAVYVWDDNKIVAFSRGGGEYIVVLHNGGGPDDGGWPQYGIQDQQGLTGTYQEVLNSSWDQFRISGPEVSRGAGVNIDISNGATGIAIPPFGVVVLQRQQIDCSKIRGPVRKSTGLFFCRTKGKR